MQAFISGFPQSPIEYCSSPLLHFFLAPFPLSITLWESGKGGKNGGKDIAEQVCHRRVVDRRSSAHTALTLESTMANKSQSQFSWSSFVEPITELQRLIIALIVQGGELPRVG